MENLITTTGANPQFPLYLGMPAAILGGTAGVFEAKRVRVHVTTAAATATANAWGPDAWSPPV